jgi:hypothetical protein
VVAEEKFVLRPCTVRTRVAPCGTVAGSTNGTDGRIAPVMTSRQALS